MHSDCDGETPLNAIDSGFMIMMTSRLGTMDLNPRENSYVALEADFMKMRLFLTEFGKIVTTNEAERVCL